MNDDEGAGFLFAVEIDEVTENVEDDCAELQITEITESTLPTGKYSLSWKISCATLPFL